MKTPNTQETRTPSTRHPRSEKRFVLPALALLLLPPAALLAAPLDEDTVFEEAPGATAGKTAVLEEMVVTASRTQRRVVDEPITTKVITAEDIRQSGVTDVAELFGHYVTGHFHKNYDNGLLSTPALRGIRAEAHGTDLGGVLVLIDGHRTGTGNLTKMNLDRVERVEIIKGPASAAYGSAALGGVINIITKKGDGDLSGSLGLEYGSFDTIKGFGTLGGEVSDQFRFFATISADRSGDYEVPKYGTVYNSGTERANFGGNFIYTPSDNHEFRIGGNYAHLVNETPSKLARDGKPNERTPDGRTSGINKNNHYNPYYDPDVRGYANKSTGYADLEYNGDYFNSALHWRSLYYYIRDKNHWHTDTIPYYDPERSQTRYIDTTYGTDQQLTWKMTEWNTLLGGILYETLDKESTGVSAHLPSLPSTPAMDYKNLGLFLQDSLDLWDNRINIVFAGRYDRYSVSTKTMTIGTRHHEGSSADFDHFSPKVSAGIKFFDERLRLRGNLGQGFRAPAPNQLATDFVGTNNVHQIGNPDLKPETTLTYGFGADLLLDAFTLKLDWYHTDYKDRIQQVTIGVDDENRQLDSFTNLKDAEIGGLELMMEWQIDKTFPNLPFRAKLWSNIDISLENENHDTRIQSGKDIKILPSELTDIADYEIKSGLNLGYEDFNAQLSNSFIGPQLSQIYYKQDPQYPYERRGGFSVWNLNMSYTFADHWELKFGVYNLFNQNVEWIHNYPMAERNYRIGLTYKF